VPPLDIVVLIPESTRKRTDGSTAAKATDAISDALPEAARRKLGDLRDEVVAKSPKGAISTAGLSPAFERFDGNMYRYIPDDAWARRSPGVEVVIASALRGLVGSRDPIPSYHLSMAESIPPFGKMNRWWHDRGLPDLLAAYLESIRPHQVVDLLSLEYRESVIGYATKLHGIDVKTIDFPGMGRASQPLRGEMIGEILLQGKV